jgi:hypothetical protein
MEPSWMRTDRTFRMPTTSNPWPSIFSFCRSTHPRCIEAGEPNLPLARQTIDILAMIEEKTRGNLTGEEERLLHQILFDLRMRYARKVAR